jgi:hypothetical protein
MIMNTLTELEICISLADIMGFEYRVQNAKVLPDDPANVITCKLTDVFNPLTDKALLFDLVVSEGIVRAHSTSTGWCYHPACRTCPDEIFTTASYGEEKAACLAIITKHQEPSFPITNPKGS